MSVPAFAIPGPAAAILERLESRGHEAWAVGGCVRDSLLGLSPHDWDLCTSATPEEMTAAFSGWPVIPTGLRHGTLTVRLEKQNWEVTTYRADGDYTDHRRPDSVRFVTRVEEDLSRRDFTVNAMAWHPVRGLLDPFGGAADLKARVLRCVGDPRRRFEEDALRILRGARFAARYGLTAEEATAAAIHQGRGELRRVAPERCMMELRRLLVAPGDRLGLVLRVFWDLLCVLPGLAYLREMPGYDQQNPHHDRDLMEHTLAAVVSVPPKEALRLAALLHDGGKPCCRTVDGKGVAHYYGHPKAGAGLANAALRRLRCENALRVKVVDLIERHDLWVPPTRRPAVAGPPGGGGSPGPPGPPAGRHFGPRPGLPAPPSGPSGPVGGPGGPGPGRGGLLHPPGPGDKRQRPAGRRVPGRSGAGPGPPASSGGGPGGAAGERQGCPSGRSKELRRGLPKPRASIKGVSRHDRNRKAL